MRKALKSGLWIVIWSFWSRQGESVGCWRSLLAFNCVQMKTLLFIYSYLEFKGFGSLLKVVKNFLAQYFGKERPYPWILIHWSNKAGKWLDLSLGYEHLHLFFKMLSDQVVEFVQSIHHVPGKVQTRSLDETSKTSYTIQIIPSIWISYLSVFL